MRVAIGSLLYSLFSLVEGVGLMFRVSWAGWLAIGESAFFIPIEILELIHSCTMCNPHHPDSEHPHPLVFVSKPGATVPLNH